MGALMADVQTWFVPLLGGLGSFGSGGLWVNLLLIAAVLPASLAVGTGLAVLRLSRLRPVRGLAAAYVELAKATPFVMGVFWFYYFLPFLFGPTSLFITGVVALSFFGSAAFAEIVRSGWNAIGAPQMDAARLSGLPPAAILGRIILPQMAMTMLPALVTASISLFKDTATVFVIGLIELTETGMVVANRHPEKLVAVYTIMGSIYLAICTLASLVGRSLERRTAPRISVAEQ